MRKRKILTILLTAVLFLTASLLTVFSVFRVNAVTLQISTVSEAAKEEAELLEKTLLELYDKESIFSVEDTKAREAFESYPHFRFGQFEKSYPNRLIFVASEDPEVYAVEKDGNYFILNGDGVMLEERDTPKNRSDGEDNVIINGLSFTAEKGEPTTDETSLSILAFCKVLDEKFEGLRSNILSVTLVRPTSNAMDDYLVLQAREGVQIWVYAPLQNHEEKATKLLSFYENMSTEQRICGKVIVPNVGDCHYTLQ